MSPHNPFVGFYIFISEITKFSKSGNDSFSLHQYTGVQEISCSSGSPHRGLLEGSLQWIATKKKARAWSRLLLNLGVRRGGSFRLPYQRPRFIVGRRRSLHLRQKPYLIYKDASKTAGPPRVRIVKRVLRFATIRHLAHAGPVCQQPEICWIRLSPNDGLRNDACLCAFSFFLYSANSAYGFLLRSGSYEIQTLSSPDLVAWSQSLLERHPPRLLDVRIPSTAEAVVKWSSRWGNAQITTGSVIEKAPLIIGWPHFVSISVCTTGDTAAAALFALFQTFLCGGLVRVLGEKGGFYSALSCSPPRPVCVHANIFTDSSLPLLSPSASTCISDHAGHRHGAQRIGG